MNESNTERKFRVIFSGRNYRNERIIYATSQEEAENWVWKHLGRVIEIEEITAK